MLVTLLSKQAKHILPFGLSRWMSHRDLVFGAPCFDAAIPVKHEIDLYIEICLAR